MKELFQHAAMTDGVTVRVAVNFLPEQSRIEAGKWFWVYHIRLENDGPQAVQLLTRHWRITDGRGMVNHVEGEGVVGEQPVLLPGQSHDYVSGCPLTTPHGSMEGHYTFRREDGVLFEAAIPYFPLAAPAPGCRSCGSGWISGHFCVGSKKKVSAVIAFQSNLAWSAAAAGLWPLPTIVQYREPAAQCRANT
jgi:ApaG protein